jgi:hypothetical protein
MLLGAMVMMLSRSSLIVIAAVGIACLSINKGVAAFVAPSLSPNLVLNAHAARVVGASSSLFHNTAPKHDVSTGGNPWANLTPEQVQRVQAHQEHQQNGPNRIAAIVTLGSHDHSLGSVSIAQQ